MKKFCNWIQSIYCQSIALFRSIHRSFTDFFFMQNRESCLKRRHTGSRNLKRKTCVISKEEREIAITHLCFVASAKMRQIFTGPSLQDIFCRFLPITNLCKKEYNGNWEWQVSVSFSSTEAFIHFYWCSFPVRKTLSFPSLLSFMKSAECTCQYKQDMKVHRAYRITCIGCISNS